MYIHVKHNTRAVRRETSKRLSIQLASFAALFLLYNGSNIAYMPTSMHARDSRGMHVRIYEPGGAAPVLV